MDYIIEGYNKLFVDKLFTNIMLLVLVGAFWSKVLKTILDPPTKDNRD